MTAHIVTVTGPAWLSSNDRRHHMEKWRITQAWKANAGWAIRQARTPRFEGKVRIVALCLFTDRRKRDPLNYADTAKACIDGIRDQYVKPIPDKDFAHVIRGVLADDDAAHVDGPDMRSRVEPGIRTPTLELHITNVGDEL